MGAGVAEGDGAAVGGGGAEGVLAAREDSGAPGAGAVREEESEVPPPSPSPAEDAEAGGGEPPAPPTRAPGLLQTLSTEQRPAQVDARRKVLEAEWANTQAIYTKTGGLYGFEAWWPTAEVAGKLTILHMAREHTRQEVLGQEQGPISTLDVLCPELTELRIGRLASGKALPALIQLYINNIEAVRKRDLAYISTNVANLKKHSKGPLMTMPNVQEMADDKMLLMLTFLRAVLVFFNTALSKQLGAEET